MGAIGGPLGQVLTYNLTDASTSIVPSSFRKRFVVTVVKSLVTIVISYKSRKPGQMHLAGEEREGMIRLSSALARVQQASWTNDEDDVVMSGERLSLN